MAEKQIEFKNNDYDIDIKEKEYQDSDGIHSHYLKLQFEGNDLNAKIINMIRRACTNCVPTYGYPLELIDIRENSSIAFNNDMVRLDLSYLPIYDVDPNIYDLEEEYWKNVNYADKDRKKHLNEKIIEFYVSYHNNSSDIVRVTTNDSTVTVDGKQVEMYNKKYPILLIELKANQTFKCHMKGVLGVGERRDDGAIWKGCKRSYYNDLSDDNDKKSKKVYEFVVHGNEQYSEYQLLNRTCQYLIKRLLSVKKLIGDQFKKGEIEENRTIKFILDNEDHTIGEPINYELQDHKDIKFSGFSKADHLIKAGVITVSCEKDKESPIDAFFDSIDVLIDKINRVGYVLTKLEKKDKKGDNEEEKSSKKIEKKEKKSGKK
jgi:DNA-directed RNA polymerase subunit L